MIDMQLKEFWSEADVWDGEFHSYKCVARRNHSKAWCGYVGIPSTHPFFGKGYSERIPVPDRSAVTLHENAGPLPIFIEALHEDDGCISLDLYLPGHGGITYAGNGWFTDETDLWYFGFDCAHSGDLTPFDAYQRFINADDVYRNLEYVKKQMELLAQALKENE